MMSQLLIFVIISVTAYTTHGFSKYGRTCADIGCLTNEVCIMAEDPCSYRGSEGCGSYPTCQRKANAVANCDTHVCPPTTYCRMDGSTPKCIADNGPLGGKNGNPNANLDPHNIHNNHNDERPSAPLYPQIPRGQTTTRSPLYRPNNNGGGGYQGGSIGSGYPGQPSNNGGGGYGGGTIGGGYPGGYSGYPSQNNNPYAGYPNNNGHPSSGSGGYYPSSNNNGYSNYPYNQNPYYASNNNNRYGHGDATTANPLFNTLKNLGKKLLKDAIGNIKF